jgi:hypothetical protein
MRGLCGTQGAGEEQYENEMDEAHHFNVTKSSKFQQSKSGSLPLDVYLVNVDFRE